MLSEVGCTRKPVSGWPLSTFKIDTLLGHNDMALLGHNWQIAWRLLQRSEKMRHGIIGNRLFTAVLLGACVCLYI